MFLTKLLKSRDGLQSIVKVTIGLGVFLVTALTHGEQPANRDKKPVNQQSKEHTLRYRWDADRNYHYQLSVTAKLDELEFKTHGHCGFTVQPNLDTVTSKSKATAFGTAFVVLSNGYLITAAHVVDEATTIKVTLNGKSYDATVVDSDTSNDVALLKIDAEKLERLKLADSEQVGLGQSIWALGYPLSDVLGSSLKINAGMISGVNQTQAGKVFQLDAKLNPGNSGGPILNEAGQVIAVVIQRIAGKGISDVGLTRPVNSVLELMNKNGLAIEASPKSNKKLDGQAIVQACQKSLAFVEVEIDPMRDATKLRFAGMLMMDRKRSSPRNSFSVPSYSPPKPRMPKGTFLVSPVGALSDVTEDEEMPFALGHLVDFILEPLPSAGQSEWKEERTNKLAVYESDEEERSPFGPPIPGRPRPSFFELPRKEKKKIKVYDVNEVERFKILKTDGELTTVAKTIEMKTTDDPKRPFLEMSGKGEWVFNHSEGCLESSNAQYDFVQQVTPNLTIRVPIEIKINYIEPKVLAANEKKANELQAAAEVEQNKKKVLTYEQMPTGKNFKRLQKIDFPRGSRIRQLSLSNDGTLAAIANSDDKISLFDGTKSEPSMQLAGLKGSARMIVFSPDGQFLIAGSGFDCRGWNLKTGETFGLTSRTGSYADHAAFSPDSRYVFLASPSNGVDRFEIGTGLSEVVTNESVRYDAMVVSADGNSLILADNDKELVHVNLSTKQRSNSVSLQRNPRERIHYQSSALSPAGIGAFGSFDHVDVLKLDDASKLLEIPVRGLSREGLVISRDGRFVAIASSSDKTVVIWDIPNKKRVEELQVDTISAESVVISGDGRFLVTVGLDQVLQRWEKVVN